ncbi:gamma carbonic anhydrase family protein [Numidum massiliense]|uniref:gamma carbonic anhydrase family protein n=1 Tax=Numidum massiliense TaxID=1522315 RepID=UPI0006D58779|nr:gamma carbonic anhydrase family protein [Numidum massiliense]
MIHTFGGYTPTVDPTAYVAPGVQLIGNVSVAAEATIWFNTVVRGDNAPIVIGERVNVQDGCTVHVDADYPVALGRDVSIGHNVIVHGCTVHDGALVGMGSIVLNGAVIGEQALIGAGTLITEGKVIPPRTLVMGRPGRVVRELTEKDLEMLRLTTDHYVQKGKHYREESIREESILD